MGTLQSGGCIMYTAGLDGKRRRHRVVQQRCSAQAALLNSSVLSMQQLGCQEASPSKQEESDRVSMPRAAPSRARLLQGWWLRFFCVVAAITAMPDQTFTATVQQSMQSRACAPGRCACNVDCARASALRVCLFVCRLSLALIHRVLVSIRDVTHINLPPDRSSMLDENTKKLLASLVEHHDKLVEQRNDPDTMQSLGHKDLTKLNQDVAHLSRVVQASLQLEQAEEDIRSISELLGDSDAEMVEMAKAELETAHQEVDKAHGSLLSAMAPKAPIDSGNAILEIRAGTGGQEAGLFAGELLQAYSVFIKETALQFKIIESNTDDLGGIRTVSVNILGEDAYVSTPSQHARIRQHTQSAR